VNKATMMH